MMQLLLLPQKILPFRVVLPATCMPYKLVWQTGWICEPSICHQRRMAWWMSLNGAPSC